MDFTGVALGSGVNQYMKMDEMARANKKLEMEKALADQQLERGRMDLDQLRSVHELGNKYRNINSALARGELDHPDVQGFVNTYNQNQGAFNNGYTMALGQDPKGGRVINFTDKDGNLAHSEPWNPQNVQRLLGDAYRTELAFSSPDYFYKNYALGQKDRELGTDERYKTEIIPGIHADDRASRERVAQMQLGPQWANVNKPQFGQQVNMYDSDGNPAVGTVVRGPDGSTRMDVLSAPKGYSFTQKTSGAGANPYTTMTDIEKMDYKAYQDAVKELGVRPSDPAKAAQWDNANAALVNQHRVGHLVGGGQQGGPGFNVGSLGKPAPAAAPTGTGLKKPVTADQFKGWKRTGTGDNVTITDPSGKRMSADDFEKQYSALPQLVDYQAPDLSGFRAIRGRDGSVVVDTPQGGRVTGKMFEQMYGVSVNRLPSK